MNYFERFVNEQVDGADAVQSGKLGEQVLRESAERAIRAALLLDALSTMAQKFYDQRGTGEDAPEDFIEAVLHGLVTLRRGDKQGFIRIRAIIDSLASSFQHLSETDEEES